MSGLLIYVLKALLIQGLIYLVYRVFLQRSGQHALNRLLLLSGLVFSFIIPLLKVPVFMTKSIPDSPEIVPVILEKSGDFIGNDSMALVPVAVQQQGLTFSTFLLLAFVTVCLFNSIRSVLGYRKLAILRKKSQLVEKNWYSLYQTSENSPFSFFRNIFIPQPVFKATTYQQILTHECVHARQWHSLDRVFVDVLLCLFWFNPLLYLYKKALIEIHEFQADEGVIKAFKDPIGYQEILFTQLQHNPAVGMVSHFNFSIIKKRIKMINKTQKTTTTIYSLTIPLLISMFFLFGEKTSDTEGFFNVKSNDLELLSSDFDLPDWNKNDYKPSILPLKETSFVKLTSNFGMRMHPKKKIKMHHNGIDLSCKEGSEVLATADGIIIKAKEDGEHGMRIEIDHNGQFTTAYSHLSSFNVKVGEQVAKGSVIGQSGNTGASFGPHLHYEVIEKEKGNVDPLPYITNFNFKAVIEKTEPSPTPESKNIAQLDGQFKVVIDPGHGGKDPGATAENGEFEKDILLQVALELAKQLKANSTIEVDLTRDGDQFLTIEDRVAKAKDADLFISLHAERHAEKDQNFLLQVYPEDSKYSKKAMRLAKLIAYEFLNEDKEAKVAYSTGYHLLNNVPCPAVMFNVALISNTEVADYICSDKGQKETARELSDAISLALL